ncbi:hypothetical protein K1W69_01105 [Hoeflea sp. WL0058]|uniref:Uncharacterized protein n=1 Tax=Flavimaribacter sediminis TaxID=2865987 RepID=A0AAE3CZD8_9HYPH|nr:hypothetical protein [Flavimaribacter sediminis]MBW8635768.1 hypothetical protein [Flavimaribacter sediminis]
MDNSRDPQIQALFASAEHPLDDQAFGDKVMASTLGSSRRSGLVKAAIGVALVFCLLLTAPLLLEPALALGKLLLIPLFTPDNAVAAFLISPVNTLALPVGMLLLLLWFALRKLSA